jgi:Zn-finger nucleic acid-binding protein
VVTVESPTGHEAAVVRCSSCGAPRQEGSLSCDFCGADFTLHERDLDTVCPKCLARVSHQAKFCHHCATALVPEQLARDETSMSCPVCGPERYLTNRQIGDVAVMECDRCAGLWLGTEPFKHLAERASSDAVEIDRFVASDGAPPSESAQPGEQSGKGWRYRRCPVCDKMMHRRNYGRSSGVIIDACRDHGIWFDADELPRILAWIRSGKEAEAEKRRADQTARDERIKRRMAEASDRGPAMGGRVPFYGRYRSGSPLGGFLDEIFEGLFGLD